MQEQGVRGQVGGGRGHRPTPPVFGNEPLREGSPVKRCSSCWLQWEVDVLRFGMENGHGGRAGVSRPPRAAELQCLAQPIHLTDGETEAQTVPGPCPLLSGSERLVV